MRIILDENLPHALKLALPRHSVTTVQEQGLAGTRNGELLAQLEGRFDVFMTADKNLRYQQNLTDRTLAIVELPTNRLPALESLYPAIAAATDKITPATYVRISQ